MFHCLHPRSSLSEDDKMTDAILSGMAGFYFFWYTHWLRRFQKRYPGKTTVSSWTSDIRVDPVAWMISRDHELKLCAGHPRLRPNHVIVGPLLLLLRYVWVFTFSCQFGFVQKKYLKLHMVYHCCCHTDDHVKIYRYTTFSDIHTCMHAVTHTHFAWDQPTCTFP